MLLRFRCKNLYSIRDQQELSLVATRTRAPEHDETLLDTPIEGVKALRAAAIFGANASGKTNLLLAMTSLRWFVSESWRIWEPTGKIPLWRPFLLDDESGSQPAMIEIDFVIDQSVYNYGFQFTKSSFEKEWLIDRTGRRDKKLFERTSSEDDPKGNFRFPGNNLAEPRHLNQIAQQTRPNSLFLSAAAQFGHPQLSRIAMWITERFYLTFPNELHSVSYTTDLCSSSERQIQIRDILNAIDTGIADIQISEENPPQKSVESLRAMQQAMESAGKPIPDTVTDTRKPRKRVTMLHRGKEGKLFPLRLELESEGTRAFYELLGPILCELETSSILLIDEIESSLHPNLARRIVAMFNDPKLNPRGAQLIFATHSPYLLDPDLLRRDQIWLAEKNQEGASEFRSLVEYNKPRHGQNLSDAYLHGRFGGVPFIDEDRIHAAILSRFDSDTATATQNDEA